MNDYSKKILKVPTVTFVREQDQGRGVLRQVVALQQAQALGRGGVHVRAAADLLAEADPTLVEEFLPELESLRR